MVEYIALLRGINVGKAKRIAMADLRSLLESLGHTQVRTLLNSGNAVFRTGKADTAKIASAIEREIAARLKLAVPTIVVTSDDLETIIRENPLSHATADPSRFLVAFVQHADVLRGARSLLAQAWEAEALAIGTRAAYLWCDGGLHKSKLALAFTRATRNAATTRNWATVLKLKAIVSEGGPARAIETRKVGKAGVVLLAGGNPQVAKAEGDAPVQSYIAAMPGWKSDLGKRLDALITKNVPDVRKAVKWNSPFYGVEGRGWFLSFHVFTKYVKVTFFRGASLRPAPPGGTPRSGDSRWIDIREDDELDEAQMAAWVKQAAALPGWVP